MTDTQQDSDKNSLKWKSALLSSGLPLEAEAARALHRAKFYVTPNFTYSRKSDGLDTDFSVDIHARAFPPFNEDDVLATVELLVECKFRHSSVQWLFIHDHNDWSFSSFTSGNTLRAIDTFSSVLLPDNCTTSLDRDLPYCTNWIEVNTENASAYSKEIRHGLMQLQYAIPLLLHDAIHHSVEDYPGIDEPFFFCPILVTNAPIRVAKPQLTIEDVRRAKTLESISEEVPLLVAGLDAAPDFLRHVKDQFQDMEELSRDPQVRKLDRHRKKLGESDIFLPSAACRDFLTPRGFTYKQYFQQFVVCSMATLPRLLSKIKRITNRASSISGAKS